jgi:O-antigen ligase
MVRRHLPAGEKVAAVSSILLRQNPTEQRVKENKVARLLERSVFYLLMALLMFGPLAFGAVDTWSLAIVEIGGALLLFAWTLQQLFDKKAVVVINPLFYPACLLGLVILAQLAFRTAAYDFVAHGKALEYLSYGAILFVSVQVFRREERARQFFLVLAVFGFLMALFAILQNATAPGMLYWVRKPRYPGWIFGTYVNHSHYAGLMELLTPIPVVLTLSDRFTRAKRAMFGFTALIMAGSLVLSQSRAGMISLALELLFLGMVVLRSHRKQSAMRALALVTLALVVFIAWYGSSAIFARFQSTQNVQQDSAQRLRIVKDSLPMVAQRPILGWGIGNFPVAYPQFRTFYTDYYVNQAHNDYVQFLVECGLVGAVAVLLFVVMLFWNCFRRVRGWQERLHPALCLAALTGCVGLLVHSFADFNLQIPANAVLFYVLAGASLLPRETRILRISRESR